MWLINRIFFNYPHSIWGSVFCVRPVKCPRIFSRVNCKASQAAGGVGVGRLERGLSPEPAPEPCCAVPCLLCRGTCRLRRVHKYTSTPAHKHTSTEYQVLQPLGLLTRCEPRVRLSPEPEAVMPPFYFRSESLGQCLRLPKPSAKYHDDSHCCSYVIWELPT